MKSKLFSGFFENTDNDLLSIQSCIQKFVEMKCQLHTYGRDKFSLLQAFWRSWNLFTHTWLIKITLANYPKIGSSVSQAYCLAIVLGLFGKLLRTCNIQVLNTQP